MDPLRWVFEIIDRVTGPVRRMSSSFFDFNVGLNQTKELIGSVIRAAGGLGQVFFDATKFGVNALAYKESTEASLSVILGSAEQAKDVMREAIQVARQTPFETKDVISGYKRLLGAGFNRKETAVLFQGLGDVSAANDFNPEILQNITLQLGQIRTRGHAMNEDLRRIFDDAGGVLKRSDFDQVIAQKLGIPVTKVADMVSKGAVRADLAIFALVKAMEKMSGGTVGGMQLKLSGTINGIISSIKSIPDELFTTLNETADNMTGIKAFKGFLENVRDLFQSNSKSGKEFQKVITDVFNTLLTSIFGDLSGEKGKEAMLGGMKKFAEWVKSTNWKAIFSGVVNEVKSLLGDLQSALKTIQETARYIGAITNTGQAGEMRKTLAKGNRPSDYILGEWDPRFLYKGLMGRGGLSDAFDIATKGGVKTNLPMELVTDTGATVPNLPANLPKQSAGPVIPNAPADLPKHADGGLVTQPHVGMIGEDGPEMIIPLRKIGGMGSTNNVTINLNVDASSNEAQDGYAIADTIKAELSMMFRQLTAEGGFA